jgi:predicted enzyme related to lactoylglutathione lyase
MIIEPSAVVLYVNTLEISNPFYQDLLGIKLEVASPTFSSFKLSNGMGLGLTAKHAVEAPVYENGSGELAFTCDTNEAVDALFVAWQKKEISMVHPPILLPYGYTFLALDPDGNRLRVVSLRTGAN